MERHNLVLEQIRLPLATLLNREWETHKTSLDHCIEQLIGDSMSNPREHVPTLRPQIMHGLHIISSNAPEIIGAGLSQLTMRCGSAPFVLKGNIRKRLPGRTIIGTGPGYHPQVRESVANSRTISLLIPEHYFFDITRSGDLVDIQPHQQSRQLERCHWMVVPDLSEGGRYKVFESKSSEVNSLNNEAALKHELKSWVTYLSNFEVNRYSGSDFPYRIFIHGPHSETRTTKDDGYLHEALEHMFLVVADPKTNLGRLVPADTDHVLILDNPNYDPKMYSIPAAVEINAKLLIDPNEKKVKPTRDAVL